MSNGGRPPLDVIVAGASAPVPVEIVQDQTQPAFRPNVVAQSGATVASPTTTEEENLRSAGQRQINLVWETTQMRVALSVIWTSLTVAAILAIGGKLLGSVEIQLAAVVFLFGVANLVTGFYFGRTNHQRTGGVGGDAAGAR